MAINGIGSDFSSNFQRSFGTTTSEATSSSNLGANPSSEFDAAQTSEASSQGVSDQAVSGASDSSGISQEAQEASGSQAAQGSLSGRAEQLTAKLKESLEAITSAQESGGDTSTAVASLKETYQSGESNGGLDGVETDVKDQTEQILGIKSGGLPRVHQPPTGQRQWGRLGRPQTLPPAGNKVVKPTRRGSNRGWTLCSVQPRGQTGPWFPGKLHSSVF